MFTFDAAPVFESVTRLSILGIVFGYVPESELIPVCDPLVGSPNTRRQILARSRIYIIWIPERKNSYARGEKRDDRRLTSWRIAFV